MIFRRHHENRPRHRLRRIMLIILLLVLAAVIAGTAILYKTYQTNLEPVSTDKTAISVTITPGSTNSEIADTLLSKNIIRSDWAFEWYLRINQSVSGLKAGTYNLSADKNVPQLVDILSGGKIAAEEPVTILPGKRLDQIRSALINAGFTEQAVDAALEPAQYQDHPALSGKPAGASLEGYLYPETFHRTAETTAQDIIKLSLDEMNRYLTSELRQGFAKQGLTAHQAIIIGSVVEQEVGNSTDRAQVAQVFIKRYKTGMPLGADPTAIYGAVINDQDSTIGAAIAFDSPYNTRIHAGLPPGPIGNVTVATMQAMASPAPTDWLYFVAGDDGTTHFSKTIAEHEALTRKYCIKLCQ